MPMQDWCDASIELQQKGGSCACLDRMYSRTTACTAEQKVTGQWQAIIVMEPDSSNANIKLVLVGIMSEATAHLQVWYKVWS